ncbi:hypothetical protein HBI67_026910 [Parastagonospora nodorum]|nr:hypothetical protein HBI67_026910 [Parastagonospora nodorum]
MFVYSIFHAAVLSVYIYRAHIRPRYFSPLRHVPRAKNGSPVLSHGLAQFTDPRGDAYLHMFQSVPNSGLIYFTGFWYNDHVLLTSADALAEVLVRRYRDFVKAPAARHLLGQLLGKALLILEGDEHKAVRRDSLPAFNHSSIKSLHPVFWSKAIDMADMLQEGVLVPSSDSISSKEIDIWEIGSRATLDTIGLATVGQDFNSMREPHVLTELYDILFNPSPQMSLYFVLNASLPRWALRILARPLEIQFYDTRAKLNSLCIGLVKEMKGRAKDGTENNILSRLMRGNAFSEDELATHLLMTIGAGYEPTAAAFCWAIWFLAAHPDWQTRLRKEIQDNISHRFFHHDADGFVAGQVLEELPILNAVCNETSRFMPTSPITTRVAADDTTILGHPVRRGTRVFVVPGAINRSTEAYGPKANEYDPSRWINDDTGKANNHGGASTNYAFSTFLHGPRRCIGQMYVTAAVRAFVAAFVGRYRFEVLRELTAEGITTVRPKDGMQLILYPVEKW